MNPHNTTASRTTTLRIPNDDWTREFLLKADQLLELLRQADFINDEAVQQITECQKFKNKLHSGQLLVMGGYVTPRELATAIETIDAVKQGRMTFEDAVLRLKKDR